ncbi:hypothetical protein COV82_04710 [Candidatus Peregrinibacteria bacterium CG11_big_fil_rev_8_21_14_0_20_46_8]|nr:MAG: hypothetical protein COV82_04710 [Candidatus Peregrinibacteria bacterium CG11_big_fil_rev_8_21_14_0_20_46_8]
MKIIRIIITGLILFLLPVVALAAFPDTTGHKYREAIDFVQSRGIVDGYPDGTYRPDKTMNRAEMLTIIVGSRFENLQGADCFPDVKRADWFAPFVCKGKELGVVVGYPDGTFQPARTVTFVEALIMLQRAYDIPVNTDGVWYEDSVRKASAANIIPLDVAAFDMPFTRGHMAELTTRLLKEREGNLEEYLDDKIDFAVSYEDIQNGVNVEREWSAQDAVDSGNAAENVPEVFINGGKLSAAQISDLETTYGNKATAGRYWYDTRSGMFGLEGGPPLGFLRPGHQFGTLARTASNGATGVTINGREIEVLEYSFLSTLVGFLVLPGDYWFDETGNMGVAGSDLPLTNYWLLLVNASAVSGGGGVSETGNSAGGCSYINIPGSSGVSAGFHSLGCG